MSIRKRRSDRSGRAPLPSSGGRRVATRDQRRRFWAAIAAGLASEDAAIKAGVSQAVGTRWFRKAGGMPPAMFGSSAKPLSGRYLSLGEREEIALLRVQGRSMQEIGRRLGGRHRRSRGSCAATLPLEAGVWSIVRPRHNGMRSDPLVGPNRRSSYSTRHCAYMSRNDWLALSSLRTELPFPALPCPGKDVGMDRGRIGAGRGHGARSRSLAAYRSTSLMMGRCASATKPSIRRCSSKVEGPCAAS